MKIRNKITIIFVLFTALLLIAVFVFVYFSVKKYTANEFYLRLSQRATIAAQAYLEEDELNTGIYEDIRKRHLQTLPNEQEKILKIDTPENKLSPPSYYPLDLDFFTRVLETGYAETKIGENYFAAILYNDNQGNFVVILSAEDQYGQSKMQNLFKTLVTAFILSLIVLFVIGQFYAKQVLKPISDIIGQVNKIRAKNLHLRLVTNHNKDELGDLSRTFNNMLDRLETSFELQSSFVHNASHELKTPLTAIIGQTEVSLSNVRTKNEYIETLLTVEKEALRLNELINALLELTHTEHDLKGLVIESIRVDELLMGIKMGLGSKSSRQLHINFKFLPNDSKKLIFHGNPSLIKVAFLNIIDNALKFSQNGNIQLGIKATENTILISIEDEGVGIPKEELKSVFEPFFRGSNVRKYKGFGFGLPLAHKIIRLHGGDLKIYSEVGKGTSVIIELPNLEQGFEIAR